MVFDAPMGTVWIDRSSRARKHPIYRGFPIWRALDHESSSSREARAINPCAQLNVKRHAMLKDLSGPSEEPELNESDAHEPERDSAHFRASLWLGIAADIRRERLSRQMKGHVSC
jgi:hypothetical protein